MKWIGQHIWDFISRFRSKVYLEDVDNAGSDTDAFLVKKSDGEIAIRTGAEVLSDIGASSESTDLEFSGSTANGVLTYGGAAQIDVESTLIYSSNILAIEGTDETKPSLHLVNSGSTTSGGNIIFNKETAGSDGDDLGWLLFKGSNASGSTKSFARFLAEIGTAANTDEAGKVELTVAASDGTTTGLQQALTATGHGTSNKVDVSIGYGAASTTTIAGTLTMGSTAFVNNSGVVQVATQGTIDHDSLANFVANEHLRWDNDVSGTATIHTNNITDLHGAGVDGAANQLLTDNGNGTVSSEQGLTWDGSDFDIISATSGKPEVTIENTTVDNKPSNLSFYKNRSVGNGTADDYIGTISFDGKDASGNAQEYASIMTQIVDPTHTDEAGMMELKVASSTGTASSGRNFIKGIGSASNNDVDVTIGYGVTSVTTLAGDLDIDGDTITSAGVLKIIPADVSGLALHIDADADTDNEVQIDAGVLDVNVTATATIDVATSLTITGKTLMNNRTLSVTPGSSAGEFDGDVVYTGTTTGMTTGALYVYVGTGNWVLANAGAEATTKGLLAIALGDESDVDGMLLRGMVTTTTVSGTQDEGAALYLRATNGAITTVAPNSSGQFVRVVGYCIENSNNRIYFNPDNTYIEIA